MRRPRSSTLAVLVVLLMAVAAGAWFVRDHTAERRAAQARWDAREPASYAYSYSYCGGMCADCTVDVTVRDGVVAEAVVENPQCGAPDPADALTIDDLLAIAEDHDPWPWSDWSVSFDERWGFPTAISFTCDEGVMDCGGGWSVRDFRVLG